MGKFSVFLVGVVVGVSGYHYKAELNDLAIKIPEFKKIIDRLEHAASQPPSLNKDKVFGKTDGAIIAIDVGHGKENFGATSARGYTEFSYNLNIANRLASELSRRGIESALINAEGSDIGVKERPAQAVQLGASMFVSIHHDSADESDIKPWTFEGRKLDYTTANSGYSIFVDKDNADSLSLAASIGRGFNGNGLTPTSYHADNHPMINKERGVYHRPSLGVLKAATIPAVLVECGVIKNKDDEEVLMSAEGQAAIVDSIADGIESVMKGGK